MRGEVVFMSIYDIGNTLEREKIKNIFSNAEDFSVYEHDKAIPEEIAHFNIPAIFNLKEQEIKIKDSVYKFKAQVAIYDVGAFSIRVRVPFEHTDASFLSKITFDGEYKEVIKSVSSAAHNKVEKALSKLVPGIQKEVLETYRFYFIDGDQSSFFKPNRRLIAGLLLEDKHYSSLNEDYVDSTLHRSLSYYNDDIIVVDWDAAFMMDKNGKYEHELLVCEIANVQFAALRAYQEKISNIIRDASNKFSKLARLGFLRILRAKQDLIKLNDELGKFYDQTKDTINNVNNIIFGFGEWYLARLYAMLSDSFRLKDAYSALYDNLEVVEKIRSFIQDRIEDETSSSLEWIVIILIVIEVAVEVVFVLNL